MANVAPHIFREYDIRGLAEEELTPTTVELIGRALGTRLVRKGVKMATVGGDVRLSTERIRRNLIDGLTATGLDVIDIGKVTTPLFYWSLYHFEAGGGVMITGSHNPKEFNGLKLADGKATLFGEQIQEILQTIVDDHFVASEEPGTVTTADISDAYIAMLLSKLKLKRPLKVVADAGNGTAALMIEPFLKGLGCEVIPLFCEPDGTFPNHHPDPTKRENLQDLIAAVLREGADVGIGFDGDSDRIGVVDDRGRVIFGDTLMALYWREILPDHPGTPCIVEVKSSQALVEEIERMGGQVIFYKSGHSLIKAKMREVNALFTGEVSGHMFFADEFYGFDDAFYAAGRLLRLLAREEQKLSEILDTIPSYPSTAETRIDCPDAIKFDVIDAIREGALKDHEAITVDGVRILYGDGWGLVRASNTQPVIVARCEGQDEEALKRIEKDMKERILAAGVADFDWEY
jgi:phosphomannomutase/phosphoglucomutase